MAVLEDLVSKITNQTLRGQIEAAVADLKRRKRFGLVFEEHIPETTALVDLPVQLGALVQRRDSLNGGKTYRVINIDAHDVATIEPTDGSGKPEQMRKCDLLVIKRFGEPIYPALQSVGSVRRGGETKASHAVINGENFHALQLFTYLYEGQVDCIYIDPPYNTGARDWKYNNRYVDENDAWRHSKWLSFMDKRLRLAKRLLKPDGVLIVTIDEHEVHHLGTLLEQLFPGYLRQMITMVINPKGTIRGNFGRVEEFVFFCVPDIGKPLIEGKIVRNNEPDENSENVELAEPDEDEGMSVGSDVNDEYEFQLFRRRGSASLRSDRPRRFFPIYINEKTQQIVSIGDPIPRTESPDMSVKNGLRPIWPIDSEGNHRVWRWSATSAREIVERPDEYGRYLTLGRYNKQIDNWTINIAVPKKSIVKQKTVWWERRYDAGTHGTSLLAKFLGQSRLFSYPKSLYAVQDVIDLVMRGRKNGIIVDFFAGSGTTLHATCLLNAEDSGQRRCILVTNNEVSEQVAQHLNKQGHFQGDPEFEAHGIFEQVTRPRCEALITGHRPNGTVIPGSYVNGRPFQEGFDENIEFFRLNYLDPDEVDLGRQFAAIAPSLWLAAGGIGFWEETDSGVGFSLPPGSTYGVLFKVSRFRQFKVALAQRPDVTHVWLVTDSEEAYAEMRSSLRADLSISMLYRDYLRNFRINTEQNL